MSAVAQGTVVEPAATAAVSSDHVLQVSQLSKRYGEQTVLEPLDFTLDRGEILGIVGPSGSGKSTLLQLINLLKRPTSGSIKLDGQELTTLNGRQLRLARRRIGMAFQSAALYSRRTARKNVSLPLEYMGVADRQIREITDHLIAQVGLTERADYYPGQLSGGQKQRVGIARALALSPSVLLADEITSGLDGRTSESILKLVARFRDELNLAVLLVTHEMDVIRSVADSVLFLHDGQLVDRGRTSELLRDADSLAGMQLHGLRGKPSAYDASVVEVVYGSPSVPTDWLSRLTRQLDSNVELLEASIEPLNGSSYGRARLRLADTAKHDDLLAALPDLDLLPVTVEREA